MGAGALKKTHREPYRDRATDYHRHVHLIGDRRAVAAAEYPVKLVLAILRAFRRQLKADARWEAMHSFDAGPVPEEHEQDWWRQQEETHGMYWDDVNGDWLDPEEVRKARKIELDWMVKEKVWDKVPKDEATGKILTMRWIDTRGRWSISKQTCGERDQSDQEGA